MERFNRILISLVAVAIAGGAILTLLVATGAVATGNLPVGWWSGPLESVTTAEGDGLAILVGAAVALALGALALLFLEGFSMARDSTPLVISDGPEGVVTLNMDSIRLLAEQTGSEDSKVIDLDCHPMANGDGLRVLCDATVALGASIPETSEDLRHRIKESVEQFTGLPVTAVEVKARYENFQHRRRLVS